MTNRVPTYNKALDLMALALQHLTAKNKPELAARLLAKAAQQPDAQAAINMIEATNRAAFAKLQASKAEVKAAAAPASGAKTRVRASDEMTDEESEFPVENGDAAADVESESDFDADPLDEVEEEEEAPAPEPVPASKQMAAVLSKMTRRRDGK